MSFTFFAHGAGSLGLDFSIFCLPPELFEMGRDGIVAMQWSLPTNVLWKELFGPFASWLKLARGQVIKLCFGQCLKIV